MYSDICTKYNGKQVYLVYDGLYPELAFKIMTALTSDELCETMQWLDTKMEYSVTGYREDDGKQFWSRDLVIFVEGMDTSEEMDKPIEEQLEEDRKELEKVRQFVKSRTGII